MIQPIPDFRVTVDGRDITQILRGRVALPGGRTRPRLISMGISEKRGEEADTFDLVLDDSDDALDLPPTGAKIRVSLGWRQGTGVTPGLVDKGEFHVETIDHGGSPPALTIRAKAADFTAGLKQRRQKGTKAPPHHRGRSGVDRGPGQGTKPGKRSGLPTPPGARI